MINNLQNDNNIGWVHKTGEYQFKPWSNEGKITNFTIEKDGSRKNSVQKNSGANILFFGGSLTQGWAVDDEETFTKHFQELNKDFRVLNYGVGGYNWLSIFKITKKFPKI